MQKTLHSYLPISCICSYRLHLDVEPGKKVRFIIGFGFYLSYLFLTSGKVDKDILKSKSDFQQGAFVDVGIKYQIVSTWSIFCKFQLDSDWTTLYKESIPSHQGVEYQIMKSYEYSINLGLKYLIKSKRKNN